MRPKELRIGGDEGCDVVLELGGTAAVLVGSAKDFSKRSFHPIVLGVCLDFRVEKARVHHRAINAAGGRKWRRLSPPFQGDPRSEGVLLVTED